MTKRKITTRAGSVVERFNDIRELSQYIESREICGDPYFKWESSKKNSFEFTQTENFESADNLLKNGWSVGAEKITMTANNLTISSVRPVSAPAVVGGSVSVGRFLGGSPRCMRAKQTETKRARVVNIFYNASIPAEVETEDIIKVGSKMIAAVKSIESSGVRVNLFVGAIAKDGCKKYHNGLILQVKKDSAPLDINKIAYPLAHPSFPRRHGFAFRERSNASGNWEQYGFSELDPEILKFLATGVGILNCAVLSYLTAKSKTVEEIVKEIQKQNK